MSIASLTVWVSCYIVAQTFPMLNGSEWVGPAKTFWFYAAVSFISCLFAYLFIPETKGRTLEEIESFWIRTSENAARFGKINRLTARLAISGFGDYNGLRL